MRDEGSGNLRLLSQHGRSVLHLPTVVVGAVAERWDQPGLTVEERHPVELDRPEMHPEDDDRPTGGDEFAAAGEARLGSRRLDHHVVEPLGIDPRPEALAGFLLVRVPGLERDLLPTEATGSGDREQPERAGADDRDAGARSGAGEPQRMPRDSGRLHDGRVTDVEPRR